MKGDRFVFGGTELRKLLVQFICNVTKELFQVNADIANDKYIIKSIITSETMLNPAFDPQGDSLP